MNSGCWKLRTLYWRISLFKPISSRSSKLLFSSGLKGSLKEDYVAGTLSVEDVTELAHKVIIIIIITIYLS